MARLLSLLTGPRARSVIVAALLVAMAGVFLRVVSTSYAIERWLFWHYAVYWLACAVWLAGVLGVGHLTVTRGFRLTLPLHEATVLALAVGLFEFELAMLGLGIVHAFRAPAFLLLPLAFVAGGWSGLRRLAHGWRGLLRRRRPPLGIVGALAIGLGVIVFAMIYFAILSPDNVQFDSRWKHMSLAEDWVAYGGLRRRDEGWLFAARPHITSLLFTWAFLLPGAVLFDKMLLCAHLEFVIFLVTTVIGLPALVRRLIPRADPRVVWAARFLFPGVLLYDSSLSAGADHIGALFGVPAALLLFRAWRRLDPRPTLLLAAVLAAAVLVKETIALVLLPFPVLAVLLRAGMLGVRSVRGRATAEERTNAWRSPLLCVGAALVLTAPLWLENLIWYGDPLYPNLYKVFRGHPWSPDAAYRFHYGYQEEQLWAPSRDLKGLAETLQALVNYSFVPHDWKRFHHTVPVFGSLFTLLLVALPLAGGSRRLWALVGWVHLGIFAWFSVHHQDRYLQGLMPLMASATAAMLLALWRLPFFVVRGALVLLVGLGLVWGGDVYFLQTHAMARSPLKKSIDLLSAGFEHKFDSRFAIQTTYQSIGKQLPPGARLLLHETNINLGTGVSTVLDNPGWQYAIEYGALKSPAEVTSLLRSLGVTHVFARTDKTKGKDSLAGDIRFMDYVRRRVTKSTSVSGGILVEVGAPPRGPFDDTVAVLSCGNDYQPGQYQLEDLATPPFGPRLNRLPAPRVPATLPDDAEHLLATSEYAAVDPHCFDGGVPGLHEGHTLLTHRGGSSKMAGYDLYVRGSLSKSRPRPAPASEPEDDQDEAAEP
jgi:hypothetical protein